MQTNTFPQNDTNREIMFSEICLHIIKYADQASKSDAKQANMYEIV